jgi:hypothetical protein
MGAAIVVLIAVLALPALALGAVGASYLLDRWLDRPFAPDASRPRRSRAAATDADHAPMSTTTHPRHA